jgi:2-dehydro-3-deoxyphosphooctonate aldolase (KDO 8-P synthase)
VAVLRERLRQDAEEALAVGVDGIFLEAHPNPDKALCDGPTSLPLKHLAPLLIQLKKIWATHTEA